MTRERAKELLPVIEAYAKGEAVQWRRPNVCGICEWADVINATWLEGHEYRIKPKPLEFWALDYDDGRNCLFAFRTKEEALKSNVANLPTRIVHMREVT